MLIRRLASASYLAFALLLAPVCAQPESTSALPPTPSWAAALGSRCIGPAVMSGRITALAVSESKPGTWYAASASGGLLKTTNYGITYEHLFDREAVVSIGDVAVDPRNPEVVWVGTGEANPRNSVSFGNGVYKSIDGGKTWKHMGLKDSFQIGRILIDPRNPDVVFVAALGRLWGQNQERGLYRTKDGGQTFERVLFIDERTGVIDVAFHPDAPDTLLAATWERERDLFCTNDPKKRWGPGSGIHRSTDGGGTWTKVSAGLPSSELGRVGFSWFRGDPNVVFAVIECERSGQRPADAGYAGITVESAAAGALIRSLAKEGPADSAGLREGDVIIAIGGQRILDQKGFETALAFESKGSELEFEVLRAGEVLKPKLTLSAWPEGEGSAFPFGTRLGGQVENIGHRQGRMGHEFGGTYRSDDAGITWTRVNSLTPRPMYFSKIRVDPNDARRVWVLGISLHRSEDGGLTFKNDGAPAGVHVDHHALWIDPKDSQHMILGNDGGLYVTRDGGVEWDHHNHFVIAQFYDVAIDTTRDYRVYGGLQDNGSWGGRSHAPDGRLLNEDWFRVGGGDGFVCAVDPDDPNLIYYESQNGALQRRHLLTGISASLTPRAPRGTSYRWNWNTPFLLSHHNGRIWYTAGNYVFKSNDRGFSPRRISPEITRTERGSATALVESPRDEELLYVGTDDGALFKTEDGGRTWVNLWTDKEAPKASTESSEEQPTAPLSEADTSVQVVPEVQPETPRNSERGATRGRRSPRNTPASETGQKARPLSELVDRRMAVSGLYASRHQTDRVYLTLDGHRSDDDRPHVFVSEDRGATWIPLAGALPKGTSSARTIEEDRVREDILYLGTEFGGFVSIDRGQTFEALQPALPTVAVHAFAQHVSEDDLVVATHGRGIWILDQSWLRELTPEVLASPAHLFRPRSAIQRASAPSRGGTLRRFSGANAPSGAMITYRLRRAAETVRIEIQDIEGRMVFGADGAKEAGISTLNWNLRRSGDPRRARMAPRVPVGDYLVRLIVDGESVGSAKLRVEADPTMDAATRAAFEAELEAESAEAEAESAAEEPSEQELARPRSLQGS